MNTEWLRWQLARALHGIHGAVFDYRCWHLSKYYLSLYPKKYSKEAPPWAMRDPIWRQK